MRELRKLLRFAKPYWRRGLASLALLIAVVLIDLTIPRLVQRIIDRGINAGDMQQILGPLKGDTAVSAMAAEAGVKLEPVIAPLKA